MKDYAAPGIEATLDSYERAMAAEHDVMPDRLTADEMEARLAGYRADYASWQEELADLAMLFLSSVQDPECLEMFVYHGERISGLVPDDGEESDEQHG